MIAKLVYNSYSSWEDRCDDMGPRLELGEGRAVRECFFFLGDFSNVLACCYCSTFCRHFVLFPELSFFWFHYSFLNSSYNICSYCWFGFPEKARFVQPYSRREDLRRFPVALPQCPTTAFGEPLATESLQQQLPTGVASSRTLILGYYHDKNNGYYQ